MFSSNRSQLFFMSSSLLSLSLVFALFTHGPLWFCPTPPYPEVSQIPPTTGGPLSLWFSSCSYTSQKKLPIFQLAVPTRVASLPCYGVDEDFTKAPPHPPGYKVFYRLVNSTFLTFPPSRGLLLFFPPNYALVLTRPPLFLAPYIPTISEHRGCLSSLSLSPLLCQTTFTFSGLSPPAFITNLCLTFKTFFSLPSTPPFPFSGHLTQACPSQKSSFTLQFPFLVGWFPLSLVLTPFFTPRFQIHQHLFLLGSPCFLTDPHIVSSKATPGVFLLDFSGATFSHWVGQVSPPLSSPFFLFDCVFHWESSPKAPDLNLVTHLFWHFNPPFPPPFIKTLIPISWPVPLIVSVFASLRYTNFDPVHFFFSRTGRSACAFFSFNVFSRTHFPPWC